MKNGTIVWLIVGMLCISSACKTTSTNSNKKYTNNSKTNTTAESNQAIENYLFNKINQYRKSIGLQTLVYDSLVYTVALKHSSNMAQGKVVFGHGGFEERYQQINAIYKQLNSIAENVAMGNSGHSSIFEGWLKSEGHKKNIEGYYTHTAIAVTKANTGNYYYMQIFILK